MSCPLPRKEIIAGALDMNTIFRLFYIYCFGEAAASIASLSKRACRSFAVHYFSLKRIVARTWECGWCMWEPKICNTAVKSNSLNSENRDPGERQFFAMRNDVCQKRDKLASKEMRLLLPFPEAIDLKEPKYGISRHFWFLWPSQ